MTRKRPPPLTRETADRVVQKLLTALWLYPNYRVDSRGPSGLIFDIIEDLRPDIAQEMGDEALDAILERHFPES